MSNIDCKIAYSWKLFVVCSSLDQDVCSSLDQDLSSLSIANGINIIIIYVIKYDSVISNENSSNYTIIDRLLVLGYYSELNLTVDIQNYE